MNYLHYELARDVPRPGTERRNTGVDVLYPAEMAIVDHRKHTPEIR